MQLCPTDPTFDSATPTTLLHWMTAMGDLDRISNLIDLQRETNPVQVKTAKTKSTALHMAVDQPDGGNPEVIRFLMEAKADVFATNEWKHSPLSLLAKASDNADVADILIQRMIETDSNNMVRKSP
jgi:ankyrin repeat protein